MIDINAQAVTNATIWLREKYSIPEYEIIEDLFCEEFDCDIEWTFYENKWPQDGAVHFRTKHDEMNFILRWS